MIEIIVVLIVVGVLVFLMERAPFIDGEWKGYIRYAAIFITVIWLLGALFGHWPTPQFQWRH